MSRSPGIELNYGVSLAALLALAMMMTAFVMLILWQRDLVREQTIRGQTALSIGLSQNLASDYSAAGPTDVPDHLQQMINITVESSGALCGATRFNDLEQFAGSEQCPSSLLSKALQQAASLNQPITLSIGTTWGIVLPGPSHLILATPVNGASGQSWTAGLVLPLTPVYETIRHSQRLVLAFLLVNLIILTAIGLFRFHKLTVRPINRLVRLADSYSESEDARFPALPERSEFGRLSNSLSSMLQRIEQNREELHTTVHSLELANQSLRDTQQEMIRTEKMASIGRLAAGLAHEIGNPLGIIQGYLGLLGKSNIDEEERTDFSNRAEKELQRISSLLRQLLDLSRSLPAQLQQVSIHAILSELLPIMQVQPLSEGIEISSQFNAVHDTLQGDPERLRQVFLNCLLNSIDAVHAARNKSGLIKVTTKTEPDEKLCVTIEDNGTGISSADLANAFDPFFTTKEPGKGTGLGLSVSLTIIEDMGGQMEIESRQGEGSLVHIRLPCEDKLAQEPHLYADKRACETPIDPARIGEL